MVIHHIKKNLELDLSPALLASNPNISVWVSASAGMGKTKILTDRVLRLLLDGNEPDKILCLTFTKAAAAEMFNRVNQELSRWTILSDEILSAKLKELTGKSPNDQLLLFARKLFIYVLDSPDGLRIQTIHSFCQSLVQRFPVEAGIAANFKVISDHDSNLLLRESKLNLLTVKKNQDDPLYIAINHLAWQMSDAGINLLIKEIIDNKDKFSYLLSDYDDVQDLISIIYKKLLLKPEENTESIISLFFSELKIFKDDLIAASSALKEGTALDVERGNLLSYLINEEINSFDEYKNIFLTKEDEPRKKLATKQLLIKYPHIEDILFQEQSRVIAYLDKYQSAKVILFTQHLLYLSYALIAEYNNLKMKKSLLDYEDLINISDKLLDNNDFSQWILYKLDGGINHILIDEAQDTSKEQWNIIKNLSNEFFSGHSSRVKNRTLFVVGDEKQSIFSFQGADPITFGYMNNYFQNKIIDNQFVSVNLDRSFRSTRPILELVDKIFNRPDIKAAVSYNNSQILHQAHRFDDYGLVTLWPLVTFETEKSKENLWESTSKPKEKNNAALKLAELIAEQIKKWLTGSILLKGKARPIKAGDIMILVRRRNEFTDLLIRELKKQNLPVAGIDRMKITNHIAVMDLISLGNFLLLPEDDHNLAILLKSPLIGINEEELFELCIEKNGKSLWDNLKIKSQHIYEYLSNLLKKSSELTPFALYSYILETLEMRKAICARLGQEANDPIDEFINLALLYEVNNIPSLQALLHWLQASSVEIKRDLEIGQDQIRIMTVHSSKGLQAPIVILPDTTYNNFNRDMLLWDENIVLWPGAAVNSNNYYKKLKSINLAKSNNEDLRLLYVALTRAEDELIICGYYNSIPPSENSWYNIIKNSAEWKIDQETQVMSLSYGVEYSIPKEDIAQIEKFNVDLPDFFHQSPKEEESYIHIIPSYGTKLDGDILYSPLISSYNFLRGRLVHKLLQLLPETKANKRMAVIKFMLDKYAKDLDSYSKRELLNSCVSILKKPEFSFLFAENSQAEVAISGIIDDKYIVSGKIDRLVVSDEEVLIIDYKTNRVIPNSPEDIPDAYLKQMLSYSELMTRIYPNKIIKCGLVWTEYPLFMQINL